MFRAIAWFSGLATLALIAGVSASKARAQQVCVEDQYGRVVCGRQVNLDRGNPGRPDRDRVPPARGEPDRGDERYQGPPPERDDGPPPERESASPSPRDYAPPNRQFGPPPSRESAAPPAREFGPPPRREFGPPPRRESAAPSWRDDGPPRDRNYAPPSGREYPRPSRDPDGQLFCPRSFTLQDGRCMPYIAR